jgi:hypothetical protein
MSRGHTGPASWCVSTVLSVADAMSGDPLLAEACDRQDPGRSDLDTYPAIAGEATQRAGPCPAAPCPAAP